MARQRLAELCVALAILASIPATAGAMSPNVAVSAGSFFAAAIRCEAANLITPGQTEELLGALDPYLSKSDKTHIAAGRARGEKDGQVFIDTERKWMTFTPDTSSCYRVQGVLDDYKAQLGE
ncbi:MAG: hypothetical protein JSS22_22230 [Proteobacteria bacterium]|nr:hypothetical protein [Pseudomonadota bacterium]